MGWTGVKRNIKGADLCRSNDCSPAEPWSKLVCVCDALLHSTNRENIHISHLDVCWMLICCLVAERYCLPAPNETLNLKKKELFVTEKKWNQNKCNWYSQRIFVVVFTVKMKNSKNSFNGCWCNALLSCLAWKINKFCQSLFWCVNKTTSSKYTITFSIFILFHSRH